MKGLFQVQEKARSRTGGSLKPVATGVELKHHWVERVGSPEGTTSS